MKTTYCDNEGCKKEADISVRIKARFGSGSEYRIEGEELDYCSKKCLLAGLKKRLEEAGCKV